VLPNRSITSIATLSIALILVTAGASAAAPPQKDEYGSHGNIWKTISAAERQEAMDLTKRFKGMISAARSELMSRALVPATGITPSIVTAPWCSGWSGKSRSARECA
jgi:hypothetical protein